jgi:hypothetical protein
VGAQHSASRDATLFHHLPHHGLTHTKAVGSGVSNVRLPLWFWRGSFGDDLAHHHDTFWMTIQRRRYRQILGPSCRLPKFANGPCGNAGRLVYIDRHPIR